MNRKVYKPSEVCEIIGVSPSLLKYWEREVLGRVMPGTFTQEEVDLLKEVRDLVFDRKLTIAGVKRHLIGKLDRLGKTKIEKIKEELRGVIRELRSVVEAL